MTLAWFAEQLTAESTRTAWTRADVDALVGRLFHSEATNLVRLARFFTDDTDAAEDLVQEAFIRLARSLHRIDDLDRVTAYLRSIVLNLARDHNRRGLVSLRHRMRMTSETVAGSDEEWQVKEDQRVVIEALRRLAPGQRNCLVLRYYLDLSNPEIAETLGVSINTVKTQLQRGMAALERELEGRV
ncbi:MAG: sigma-70 family RNA polymerase sigma factor [Acidimicrobiia bacterium]|nr:sigma-70 family RNA polymerase sigma factor [Acidimicrobiia bacterium]